MHIPKTLRNTSLAISIMILIFAVSGMIYVFITDRNANRIPKVVSTNTANSSLIPKPVPPGANSPEGVAIESVTSPVSAGSNVSASVITNAGSTCTIMVSYNGVKSNDSGLTPKAADVYGNVTWSWTVESSVPLGTWPITVTCVYNGRSAVVDSTIQVIK